MILKFVLNNWYWPKSSGRDVRERSVYSWDKIPYPPPAFNKPDHYASSPGNLLLSRTYRFFSSGHDHCRYNTYRAYGRMARLSWPGWLVKYQDVQGNSYASGHPFRYSPRSESFPNRYSALALAYVCACVTGLQHSELYRFGRFAARSMPSNFVERWTPHRRVTRVQTDIPWFEVELSPCIWVPSSFTSARPWLYPFTSVAVSPPFINIADVLVRTLYNTTAPIWSVPVYR